MAQTIKNLATQLQSGEISSSSLVESALIAAERSNSVFVTLNADQVRLDAVEVDRARKEGEALPPYAGIPITLKDLFDVRGEVTTAGSRVLAFDPPVEVDAPVVKNLRDAGFIFLGRVNMSEFAFSGMGANPHYGTPLSVWDRETQRLPGGSSSGSGVSVAEGIVPGSIGSDTAGSTRIPAAFNSIFGFKPSYGRFPLEGIYPLSPTTDAPGPLANSVECCYLLDAAMDGDHAPIELAPKPIDQLKLRVPQAAVMDDLDPEVEQAFERTINHLRELGCAIDAEPMPVLDQLLTLFQSTPLATYEAFQAHRVRLKMRADEYDPFVSWRIGSGADISDVDYKTALAHRDDLIARFNLEMEGYDAVVYPTVASLPPKLVEIVSHEAARPINFRCLRNTSTANYFDGCSISLPCTDIGEPPVGLMLSAPKNRDFALFNTASSVEKVLTDVRR
ncbi:MAG: amidase [Pseudomonadota bacterium]